MALGFVRGPPPRIVPPFTTFGGNFQAKACPCSHWTTGEQSDCTGSRYKGKSLSSQGQCFQTQRNSRWALPPTVGAGAHILPVPNSNSFWGLLPACSLSMAVSWAIFLPHTGEPAVKAHTRYSKSQAHRVNPLVSYPTLSSTMAGTYAGSPTWLLPPFQSDTPG